MKSVSCAFIGRNSTGDYANLPSKVDRRIEYLAKANKIHHFGGAYVYTSSEQHASKIKNLCKLYNADFRGTDVNVYKTLEKLLETNDVVYVACDYDKFNNYMRMAANLEKAHEGKKIIII